MKKESIDTAYEKNNFCNATPKCEDIRKQIADMRHEHIPNVTVCNVWLFSDMIS